ncbi:MAG: hypothetical protein COV44_09805 [Deltaproteobacteria bacterium CG11_big_fil_rev_8_21_14_0_20_45_16]|nr:MAG: hypothetical protein COV44_09805 [Deltaproteobacteria bacterium CG11_big_fil_rev_8_21_14_0_20_45_16]
MTRQSQFIEIGTGIKARRWRFLSGRAKLHFMTQENASPAKCGKRIWWVVLVLGIISGIGFFLVSPRVNQISRFDLPVSVEFVTASSLRNKLLNSAAPLKLVNMWATWCAPCVAEMPHLLKLYKNYRDRGVELYLVSMDLKEEVRNVEKFLDDQGVDFVTYLKDQKDNDFINEVNPDWSGGLPASMIFDAKGEMKNFWIGDLSYEDFEKEVLRYLESGKSQ